MQVVWVNQAMERYFGIKRIEVIGKDMRTIIKGGLKNIFEDPKYFMQKVFATYDDNTYLETFDCHVMHYKDRDERWLEHRSQPIRSGLYTGGRIEHYYNITDLKQTQQELSKHRDSLQELVSEKTAEIISTNSELQQQITERLIFEDTLKKRSNDLWNRIKELNCLYGISKLIQEPALSLEEIITGIVNLIPPAWQYPDITCARIIINGKEFKTINFKEKPWKQSSEIFIQNEKAGSIVVCYLEKKPESDEGPFQKEQGILLNAVAEWLGRIIEHKQVDEALKISHAAIDSSLSPIALADITGQLTYVNPSFLKLLGYDSINDVIGRAVMSFCSSRKKSIEVMETLQKKGSWMGELSAVKADGFFLDVFVSANIVVDKDDTPVCIMVSYIDTTQQKQLQNKLIRSERLAATGQLAASVAHEINSPLQAMTVLLSTIRSKYKDESELLENITLLKTGMISIRDTVKNLLDLSRPSKEKKQLTDINSLLNNTLTLVHSTLKKNKIEVKLDLSKKSAQTKASPQQIGQVFLNLITNAVEALSSFVKTKKSIKKSSNKIGKIKITSRIKKNTIVIKITDNGPGISENDMQYIFDPFYTRKKKMGMGIGLSICHGIIEDHNGTIEAHNLPKAGAVFTVTLPRD